MYSNNSFDLGANKFYDTGTFKGLPRLGANWFRYKETCDRLTETVHLHSRTSFVATVCANVSAPFAT